MRSTEGMRLKSPHTYVSRSPPNRARSRSTACKWHRSARSWPVRAGVLGPAVRCVVTTTIPPRPRFSTTARPKAFLCSRSASNQLLRPSAVFKSAPLSDGR